MEFPIDFSPNLKLHDISILSRGCNGRPQVVKFSFTFFNLEYFAEVDHYHVSNDYSTVMAEGPSELFDSFRDQLENDYWEKVKECVKQFQDDDLPF